VPWLAGKVVSEYRLVVRTFVPPSRCANGDLVSKYWVNNSRQSDALRSASRYTRADLRVGATVPNSGCCFDVQACSGGVAFR
jgi:hypothetical protein